MYNAGYGFPNAGGVGQMPANFGQAPPHHPGQNPHMQPNSGPSPQPGQQQMMFNPQQFAGMGPQGPFMPGGPNAGMMPGPGPAGMMQNAGMPHMTPNGQMAGFPQQPFTSSPYGAAVPSPAGPQQFNPNFMMAGGMPGFQMGAGAMPQQQQAIMQQRMQQHQHQQHQHQHQQQQHQQQQHQQQQQQHQQQQHQHQQHQQHQQQQQQHHQLQQQQQANAGGMSQAGTPQRPPSASQGTPQGNISGLQGQQGQQPQFSTPQPNSQAQTPTNQQPSTTVTTPQTPTFPSGQVANAGGAPAVQTPMSPGSEARDKQRFTLLLEINQELLYESMQLQYTQQEYKKEAAAQGAEAAADPERKQLEERLGQDYNQCLRRLNANLHFLAALADRKNKVPPCPAILSAPPFNLNINVRSQPEGPDGADASVDAMADREARDKNLKSLYKKLQALFPGIDPKKEPAYQQPRPMGAPGNPQVAHAQGQQKMTNQASPRMGPGQKTPQMAAVGVPQATTLGQS